MLAGYEPSDQLHTYSFINRYASILDPGDKNRHKATQYHRKFHVLDIFAAHKEQFGYSFIVIVFASYPFQQDKACEHKRRAAHGQVIVPWNSFPSFKSDLQALKQHSIGHMPIF